MADVLTSAINHYSTSKHKPSDRNTDIHAFANALTLAVTFMVAYKMKLVSQSNAIVLLLILLVAFFIEAAIFFPLPNQSMVIPLTVLEFAFTILLWQKFVTGWTEWQVDKDRIIISWTKKFAFSDITNYVFEWKDVEKIWQGMDTNYYNLKFKFTNGEEITFYHASFGNDDFNDLLKILYQTLDERKKLQPTDNFAKVGQTE